MNDPTPPPWSRSALVPNEVRKLYKSNGPLSHAWHPERIRKMNNIGKAITNGMTKQAIAPLLAAAGPFLGRAALAVGTDLAVGAAANKIRNKMSKPKVQTQQPQQPTIKTAGMLRTFGANVAARKNMMVGTPQARAATKAKIGRGAAAAGRYVGYGIALPMALDAGIRAVTPKPKPQKVKEEEQS